jgi:arylsulfatase A-like enzyme
MPSHSRNNSPYNIILIVVDALRKRNLGFYGYNKPTSPFLDMFAKKGVIFENAYSVTNATDPSLTTILTGRYPLSHGIISHGEKITSDQISKVLRVPCLTNLLKGHDYYTLAIDIL